MTRIVEVAIIGCGGMARHHLRNMLKQTDTTHIAAICETSPEQYALTERVFTEAGLEDPGQGALGMTFGRLIDLGHVTALVEDVHEPLGLQSGVLEGAALVDDDGPGEHGEEGQDEEYELDHQAGVDDEA